MDEEEFIKMIFAGLIVAAFIVIYVFIAKMFEASREVDPTVIYRSQPWK